MTITEPALNTDGLTLRPWKAADAAALTEICRTSDMSETFLHDASTEDITAWLEVQAQGHAEGTRLAYAVLTADTGEVVGNVVLKRLEPGTRTAEVGYWTAGLMRGRGVAPRAVAALAEWAFATYGLEELELFHGIDNVGSCRVAEKAGFAFVRELPPHQDFPRKGHLHVRREG
ncbi:GNAT family N-acetyltransferase [Streptomyces sp. NPDC021093]|uniref:GNAT family N-acetyltransferase n=1 Tax=Streptomyces sp. NPDC021093 TaxID=3365112 RepID=UPI0037A42B6D